MNPDDDQDDLEPEVAVELDEATETKPTENRRRRRRVGSRPKVMARRALKVAVQAEYVAPIPKDVLATRPKTRGDCRGGQRPCPWASCKYHLFLSVNPENGSIVLTFPDHELWDIPESCALDVAERGGITLEEVGVIMNLTRERIRQVEVKGLLMLKVADGLRDIADED